MIHDKNHLDFLKKKIAQSIAYSQGDEFSMEEEDFVVERKNSVESCGYIDLIQTCDINSRLLPDVTSQRILHDISNLVSQLSLIIDGQADILEEVQSFINKFIQFRKIVRNFCFDHFPGSLKDVVDLIEEISIGRKIQFSSSITENFAILNKQDLWGLLFFAVELFPQELKLYDNKVEVLLRKNVKDLHGDFLLLLDAWEKNMQCILLQGKQYITQKNIYLAIFLNQLYVQKKTLVIERNQSSIILSIEDIK